MNFNQFLQDINQLEQKGFLYYSDTKKCEEIELLRVQEEIVDLENGQKQLKARFAGTSDEKSKFKKATYVIIALRICIDEENSHYFPYKMRDQTDRYMGARINLRVGAVGGSGDHEQKNVFDTLDKLKLDKTW